MGYYSRVKLRMSGNKSFWFKRAHCSTVGTCTGPGLPTLLARLHSPRTRRLTLVARLGGLFLGGVGIGLDEETTCSCGCAEGSTEVGIDAAVHAASCIGARTGKACSWCWTSTSSRWGATSRGGYAELLRQRLVL